jgi:ribosomal protein S18 acetylase RimI-like enzyme
MEIRKAVLGDLPRILEIYAGARDFMVRTGNPNQWAHRGWPPEELIRQDISREKSFVCCEEGNILAVFYYDYGPDIDATYRRIDGAWLESGPYGVVHRIAACPGSGAGKFWLAWAFARSGHLRIDTHADNRVMQHVLEKLGFTRCGIIYLEPDNDPRIAFEKVR